MLATTSLPSTPELGFSRASPIISPVARAAPILSPLSQGKQNAISVSSAQFREVALASLKDVLSLMRIAKWKTDYKSSQEYNPQGTAQFIPAELPPAKLLDALNGAINDTFADPKHAALRIRGLNVVAHALTARGVGALVGALEEAATLSTEGLSALGAASLQPFTPSPSLAGSPVGSPQRGSGRGGLDLQRANERLEEQVREGVTRAARAREPEEYFSFRVEKNPERLVVEWPASLGDDFLRAAIRVAQELRRQRRDPSFVDFVAFQLGYQKLGQGANPFEPLKAKMLSTPGFRTDGQTSMNIADPGDGHVFATTRKARWLRGTVLHIEHDDHDDFVPAMNERVDHSIPRPNTALYDLARTRLHASTAAPTSFFAGRATTESADSVAAAATAAFRLGAAECRVAMDGLSSGEMVAFMRTVSNTAVRHARQQLCATFCLNYPIVDDLAPDVNGRARFVTNQMCVARREIALVALGGFDGASFGATADGDCAIAQLRHANTLQLVHAAHARGLRIAMCAGQRPGDIADAVAAGVDIIRHLSGMVSPVMQTRLAKIGVARDDAAASVRGRGGALFARLDSMYFEGSLTPAEAALRPKLYAALLRADELAVHRLLADDRAAAGALALGPDGEKPALARVRRMLRDEEPALRAGADRCGKEGEALWAAFVGRLRELAKEGSEEACVAYEKEEAWTRLAKEYQATLTEEDESD